MSVMPKSPGPKFKDIIIIEKDLGYTFRDKWILGQAFLCPSERGYDNSRLAWIGDQVMGLAICNLLYNASVDMSVEMLNHRKTVMVTRKFCAECTWRMGWDRLASGDAAEGRQITLNMQAELFEAVLGAQFVDSYGDYKGPCWCHSRLRLCGIAGPDLAPINILSIRLTVLRSYQKMISVKELEPVFAQENEARRKEAERREASQDRMANFQLQADLVSRRIGAASVSSDSNSEPDST